MEKKETQLNSKEIYRGRILDLFVDDVLLPDGTTSVRELVRHNRASAIVALDEDGNIILEEQFRYPHNAVLKEIPAGKCEKDEDPQDTALRELEEETGYKAHHIEKLGEFYPTVAYSDEIIYLYLATELEKTKQHLDAGEALDFYKVPFSEAVEMVKDGRIKDGKSVAAISLCKFIKNL